MPKRHEKDVGPWWKAAVLTGALGIGAFEAAESLPLPSYENDWQSLQTETGYDLRPLEPIANAKLEAKGDKYVIHIGQIHAGPSLEMTRKFYDQHHMPLARLKECQKQIGQTISYLGNKYHIKRLYLENLLPDDAAHYDRVQRELRTHPMETARNLARNANPEARKMLPAAFEEYAARDLIWAKKALAHTPEGARIAQDPLIAGDQEYFWGAPWQLAADGAIDLKPAEDVTAYTAAVQEGMATPEALARANHIREAAAIDRIREDEKHQQESVMLVYGAHHDFTDEIQAAKTQGSPFGLIRVDPKACFE